MSISCRINIAELRRAVSRIYVPGVHLEWGFWTSPFLVTTRCLLDMFNTNRAKLKDHFPADQPVHFFFDQQMEKGAIFEAWERYMASRPLETRELYGSVPRFEDDQKFLPLQAADLWAWWIRKWSETGQMPEALTKLDFGGWQGRGEKHLRLDIAFNEEQLVTELIKWTRSAITPDKIIYDVSFSLPKWLS